jgi:hypothetical protein
VVIPIFVLGPGPVIFPIYELGPARVFATNSTFGSAVPEPSAWALMLGGFGFMGYVLRRRVFRKPRGPAGQGARPVYGADPFT